MEYETLDYSVEDSIGTIMLNRPERANAFSDQLVDDLSGALKVIERSPDVRVVVITGAGRHFCAGADLRDRTHRPNWLDDLRDVFLRIERLDRPVIAAINGAARGGGCEMSLACDFRLISSSASIGLPEIKFGALAIAGGTQRLTKIVGIAEAKRMHYFGEPVQPDEARRIGLVHEVLPAETFSDGVRDFALTLTNRASGALSLAKFLIRMGAEVDVERGLQLEAEASKLLQIMVDSTEERSRAAGSDPVYRGIFGGSE